MASKASASVVERARIIARQPGPVLVEGESGTGKSTLAAAVHRFSNRAEGSLVRRGCGEFDASLLEATLFGHTRDAYTGACDDKDGVLASANGGTLLLDDIDYLSLASQSRLLRFLDDGTFFRLGEPGKPVVVDVRIVATTNKDLDALAGAGRFLPDLLFRLRRWRIRIPPLRERPEDIDALARAALAAFQRHADDGVEPAWFFSDAALELLRAMPWPGNIRHLREAVENIAVFARGDRRPISLDEAAAVLFDGQSTSEAQHLRISPSQSDEEQIHRMLVNTGWNISLTSRILGCSRTTIYERIRANRWRRPDPVSSR